MRLVALLLSWLVSSLIRDQTVHSVTLSAFKTLPSYVSLAVSNRFKKKLYRKSDINGRESPIFPESGGVEAIENAYKVISQAKTVVVLKSASNSVVCGFQISNSSMALQTPMGISGYYPVSASQHIFVTGLVGDCREVLRYAAQLYINNLYDLDTPVCSSSYLAQKISSLLQKGNGDRPFACHMFIVDTCPDLSSPSSPIAGPKIFEISAAGSISMIEAGVMGQGMVNGRRILSEQNWSNMHFEEAKKLIKHILSGEIETCASDGRTSSSTSTTTEGAFDNTDIGASSSSSAYVEEDCSHQVKGVARSYFISDEVRSSWALKPGTISIIRELSAHGTTTDSL